VKGKMSEVNTCYEAAVKDNKGEDIVGTLNVAMVISAEGKITESKVKDTNTKAPKLDQCVVDKVKGWTFPKPTPAGAVAIIYRFVFDPKKSADKQGGGPSKQPVDHSGAK